MQSDASYASIPDERGSQSSSAEQQGHSIYLIHSADREERIRPGEAMRYWPVDSIGFN